MNCEVVGVCVEAVPVLVVGTNNTDAKRSRLAT
jgi:hypothetical protein